jgi:6-phosphogluconate dehydrogenase
MARRLGGGWRRTCADQDQFRPLAHGAADDRHERLDFALVEQIHNQGHPTSACCFVAGKQQSGEFVKILTGMIEVHTEKLVTEG